MSDITVRTMEPEEATASYLEYETIRGCILILAAHEAQEGRLPFALALKVWCDDMPPFVGPRMRRERA